MVRTLTYLFQGHKFDPQQTGKDVLRNVAEVSSERRWHVCWGGKRVTWPRTQQVVSVPGGGTGSAYCEIYKELSLLLVCLHQGPAVFRQCLRLTMHPAYFIPISSKPHMLKDISSPPCTDEQARF